MAARSGSSSSRASGGLSAAGVPLDTIVVIGGAGRKAILSITYSFTILGTSLANTNFVTSRIAVVDGVDLGQAIVSPLGVGYPDALAGYSGRILFDVQVIGGIYITSAMSEQLCGQFHFPADSNEGKVETSGGSLSIIMTAPIVALSGASATNMGGALTIQYENVYDDISTRTYPYPHRS